MGGACRRQFKIKPGDVAVVMGAGPIGMVTASAARSRAFMSDVQQTKLDLAAGLGPITPVAKENLRRDRRRHRRLGRRSGL